MATDDADRRQPPAAEPGVPAGADLPGPGARPVARPTLFRPKSLRAGPETPAAETPAAETPAPEARAAETRAPKTLASLVAVAQAVAAIDRTTAPAAAPAPATTPDTTARDGEDRAAEGGETRAPETQAPETQVPATGTPAPEVAPATDAEARPAPKPATDAAPKPAPKPAPDAEARPAPKPATDAAPKPAPKPAPDAEARPAPKPAADAAPKPAPKPAPDAEARPAPKPATDAAPKPAPKPAPDAEARPAPKPATDAAPKPAPQPAPDAEARPAPKPAPDAEARPAPKPAPEAARQISPAAKLAVAEAARAAAKALDDTAPAPRKPAPEAAPARPAAAEKPVEKPTEKPAEKIAAKPPEKPPAPAAPTAPSPGAVANAARMKRRHWSVILSFLLLVVIPLAAAGWYLGTRTADQFASNVSFSVRTSESRTGGSADLLGRLSRFSGTNSTDTDILYQFIQSQELVARIDQRLDLRGLYSRHYDQDPVFSFHPEGTIEDLVRYWTRMVRISYDASNGLMALRVLAFDPIEAQRIAQAITDESILRINDLSATARADATRYATEELDQSVERLRNAREAVTAFRSRNQIVDPLANIQGQVGLLNTLQQQLASALIDLDLLRETARDLDPRITQLERRIEVIRARIADERSRFGVGGDGPAGDDYATLVGEFERLNVDREFAEQAYRSALMGYDMALAEAERTSRYLAAHITPTLAESSRYPERLLWFGGLALFLLLVWSVSVLIYYSIRDRR